MYPGQGQPPPPGFYPEGNFGAGGYPPPNAGGYQPPYSGYPQGGGYPQPGGYPPNPGYQPPFSGYPQPPEPQGFVPKPPTGGGYSSYGEDPMGNDAFDFTDKTVRLGFVRKVYSILLVQLTVTLAFVCLFTYHTGTKMYALQHPGLIWIAFGATFVCLITLACCGDVRRKAPMNFIFLGIFTVAESLLVGAVTTRFSSNEVLLAVAICAVVTLGLTLFAFQTKIDFTMMGGVLFAATLILMVFGIVLIFFHSNVASLIYSCFGALLFAVYIIYDTQMMMGGNHKYSISPEEYIFAALNLYVDIIQLFLHILSIIGASRD